MGVLADTCALLNFSACTIRNGTSDQSCKQNKTSIYLYPIGSNRRYLHSATVLAESAMDYRAQQLLQSFRKA